MGHAIAAISGSAAALLPRLFALICQTLGQALGQALRPFWHDLNRHLFDPYRPELHYMRGPGPAWRAKHGNKHGVPPAA